MTPTRALRASAVVLALAGTLAGVPGCNIPRVAGNSDVPSEIGSYQVEVWFPRGGWGAAHHGVRMAYWSEGGAKEVGFKFVTDTERQQRVRRKQLWEGASFL